jgi:hypothetical protein
MDGSLGLARSGARGRWGSSASELRTRGVDPRGPGLWFGRGSRACRWSRQRMGDIGGRGVAVGLLCRDAEAKRHRAG